MTKKEYTIDHQKHGPQELVKSFVFPVQLRAKKKNDSDKELNDILNQRRAAMSSEDKLKAILLQLRFNIEDYLNDTKFDKKKTFGFFLKHYIISLNKRRNEFAHEINIKPTVLSQYINSHRNPPQDIIIRLELHSRNNIPAATWYRLLEKENIHDLNTNLELRTKQKKYISKKASLV